MILLENMYQYLRSYGKQESVIEKVKTDETARERFVDLLELLGPEDPRTTEWRQRLTSALF